MTISNTKKSTISLLAIFFIFTLLLCVGGYTLYLYQKKKIRIEKHNELAAISKLKIDQIVNWRKDRLDNALSIFNNQAIITHIHEYIHGIDHKNNYQAISNWINSLLNEPDYSLVYLIDPTGKIIINTNPREQITESAKLIIEHAELSKKIVLSDLLRYNEKNICIDLTIPLYFNPGKKEEFSGVVLLRIDPDKFLYPLIRSWPTPSNSSESMLVRKEGNSVLFLSELHHKKNTALLLRKPLTDTLILAIQAVSGKKGILEGIDYRGIKVLGDTHPVPDSPWFLITKVDIDEIYHPILTNAIWISTITLLLILISALVIYVIWIQQLNKADRERKALLQHFDYVVKYANDIILLADFKGNIYEVNDKTVNVYGYNRNELLKHNLKQLYPVEFRETLDQQLKMLNERDGSIYETIHIDKTGRKIPVEISGRIMNIQNAKYIQFIIRDITERKKTEEEIAIYQQHLQELVDEQTADLKKLNIQLQDDIKERKLVEEKLRESEQRLSFHFENSPLAVVEWDAEFIVTQWSKEAEHIFGWKASETMGIPIASLNIIHIDDIPIVAHTMKRLTSGLENIVVSSNRNVTKDGNVIVTVWYNSILFDATGKMTSVMSLVEDITQRKLTEEELKKAKENLEIRVQERTAELVKSEERFRTTLDNLMEGCMFIGHDWTFLYVNDSVTQQIHRTREDLIGQSMKKIFPDTALQVVIEGLNVTMENKSPNNFEAQIKFNDGRINWFDYHVVPVTEGIFVMSTDITERILTEKKIKKNESILKAAQHHAKFAYWDWDIDAEILTWSEEFYIITGIEREFNMSKYPDQSKIYTPESWIILNENIKRAVEIGESFNLELEFNRYDTKTIGWLNVIGNGKKNESGKVHRLYGTIQDITERKLAEKEIKKLNDELENRVYERTLQLQTANKELEAFSYSVSHDLRAPLRSIDGWSLALIEDCSCQLDEQGRIYLDRVRNESQRMGYLIDDLLKLSRVSRVELIKERVNLTNLAHDITSRLQKSPTERRFEFIIQPGMVTFGDQNMLDIALTNLLDNAYKFTSRQPVARIEFGQSVIDEKQTYWIHDNGVGFDMSYSKNLFGAFQRMHKQSEFPGTGIGLATVQRIIHRHDGVIWVDSKPNQGTTFYFTLLEKTL